MKPLTGFSTGFDSAGVVVGFVGVWKEKVALRSDLVGVSKLNPPVAFGGSPTLTDSTAFGGTIFPKPGSLMGSLIKAAIPLSLGTTTSTFFSSTFAGTESTVSLAATMGTFFATWSSSSSSKSSLKQLRIIDSFDLSTCFMVTLLQFKIGDLSFGLMKLIRPPSSSSSSCSSLSLTTGRTTVSSYFLLNSVSLGCVGFGLIAATTSGTLLTICGNGADSTLFTLAGSRLDSALPSITAAAEAFCPTGTTAMGVEKV